MSARNLAWGLSAFVVLGLSVTSTHAATILTGDQYYHGHAVTTAVDQSESNIGFDTTSTNYSSSSTFLTPNIGHAQARAEGTTLGADASFGGFPFNFFDGDTTNKTTSANTNYTQRMLITGDNPTITFSIVGNLYANPLAYIGYSQVSASVDWGLQLYSTEGTELEMNSDESLFGMHTVSSNPAQDSSMDINKQFTVSIDAVTDGEPLIGESFDLFAWLVASTSINPAVYTLAGESLLAESDFYNSFEIISTNDVTAVPVPAALWLLGSGLLGLAGFRRYKTK